MKEAVSSWENRARGFQNAAIELLGKHEGSKARVITLGQTRKALAGLTGFQHDLFDQAVRSIEYGLFRAAHVMAWAGLIDLIEQKLGSDGFAKLHAQFPAWAKYVTVDELRDNVNEYQLVDAAKALGLLNKAETKSLLGSLSRRNECAHPSPYNPGINESLGFVSELMGRATAIQTRVL